MKKESICGDIDILTFWVGYKINAALFLIEKVYLLRSLNLCVNTNQCYETKRVEAKKHDKIYSRITAHFRRVFAGT